MSSARPVLHRPHQFATRARLCIACMVSGRSRRAWRACRSTSVGVGHEPHEPAVEGVGVSARLARRSRRVVRRGDPKRAALVCLEFVDAARHPIGNHQCWTDWDREGRDRRPCEKRECAVRAGGAHNGPKRRSRRSPRPRLSRSLARSGRFPGAIETGFGGTDRPAPMQALPKLRAPLPIPRLGQAVPQSGAQLVGSDVRGPSGLEHWARLGAGILSCPRSCSRKPPPSSGQSGRGACRPARPPDTMRAARRRTSGRRGDRSPGLVTRCAAGSAGVT